MIAISDDFKTAMKQPVKELKAYLGDLTDSDDLLSFKISCEAGLCKTAMRKLEAKYYGEHNLLGQWVHVGFGVKLPNGTYEYLDYGSFLVTEITTVKDTGVTTITGYDKMVNSMTKYTKLDITYPVDLYVYTQKLCEACGLELYNSKFTTHNDWSIDKELWENIEGITYRDILQQIAQVTGTTCVITNDKVNFKKLTDTGELLTYDNMFKLKLEPIYGEINSVVLSRTPAEDNIYERDEESITANGLTEFKIENNEIIDKDRDTAMTPIYEALHGISYYPFEATTEGLGWYEIGDQIDIVNDTGDVFNTSIFNISITMDGSLKETLKTVAETKTQTQYQYATTIAKRVKNTEIIVNKQEQYIEQIVSDVYDEDGVINEKFAKVYMDIDNIVNSVQNSGGSNLIKNSVMFAYDNDNNPTDWEIVKFTDEALTMGSDTESLSAGCVSGHGFTLLNAIARQKVYVNKDTYYTFSTRIKKGLVGYCNVRLYNDYEEHVILLEGGTESFYNEYTLSKLLPKDNYYIVEFYGSVDSDVIFTDNMFAIGEYKTNWTQANGEIMNTQVNINVDGVLVKSSVYLGDYTIMSPLEFAGYSKINGTVTKVFSLNKDITYTKKLEAEDEINMVPIKIVPITKGDLQGWAFVKSTKEV